MKALTKCQEEQVQKFQQKEDEYHHTIEILKETSEESATQIIDEQCKQMHKLESRLEEELCHKKQLQEQMQAMKRVGCHASKDNTRHE